MARDSHLQYLIDFKDEIIRTLVSSSAVMGLIANNPEIDLNSTEAEEYEAHIFDYDYIDELPISDGIWILVDADLKRASSATIGDVELYVEIICSQNSMSLRGAFRGTKGNRRDNLACEVDDLLRGNLSLGIGKPVLYSAVTIKTPQGFSGKLLTYSVEAFAANRSKNGTE